MMFKIYSEDLGSVEKALDEFIRQAKREYDAQMQDNKLLKLARRVNPSMMIPELLMSFATSIDGRCINFAVSIPLGKFGMAKHKLVNSLQEFFKTKNLSTRIEVE